VNGSWLLVFFQSNNFCVIYKSINCHFTNNNSSISNDYIASQKIKTPTVFTDEGLLFM